MISILSLSLFSRFQLDISLDPPTFLGVKEWSRLHWVILTKGFIIDELYFGETQAFGLAYYDWIILLLVLDLFNLAYNISLSL